MANNSLYPSSSPYYLTSIVNNKYLDVLNYRPIPKLANDVLYAIPYAYQYRPDLLAYDLYGDAKLWWVFAERNPNTLGEDPYFNFTAGTKIYIPKQDTLSRILGV